MDAPERWRDLQCLLNRPGNLTGPDFEPGPEILEFLQVRWLALWFADLPWPPPPLATRVVSQSQHA